MADLVITAANVLAGSNATKETGIAGETITAGQAVYKNSTTGKYMLADADSATAEARQARGVALHASLLNQPLTIQAAGDITTGATMTAGVAYYLSGLAAGGICPVADIGAGEFVCLMGVAKSTTVLMLQIVFPNVSL